MVAAGWAVGDEAARVFALRFYERLLDGANFGLAVAEARRAAKAEGGNTWGAYQCYGDPGFVLQRTSPGTGGKSGPTVYRFVSASVALCPLSQAPTRLLPSSSAGRALPQASMRGRA